MKWSIRIAFLLLLAVIWNAFSWSGHAEEARWGRRPAQFYSQLPTDVQLGGAHVLTVAHNAGDAQAATALAIAHGADVVEIDVMPINGRLYATHNAPPSWMRLSFRAPTLSRAWARTANARYVQFDLKDGSPTTIRLVVKFLQEHDDGRRVFISSRSASALEQLSILAPNVVRFLSIGNEAQLQALFDNPDRVEFLNGVSISADLVTPETMPWLKERGLLVYAWTINDASRLNALIGLGIDAVTTENLAMFDAMREAEQRRDATKIGKLFT